MRSNQITFDVFCLCIALVLFKFIRQFQRCLDFSLFRPVIIDIEISSNRFAFFFFPEKETAAKEKTAQVKKALGKK